MQEICDTLAIRKLISETFYSVAPRRLINEICDILV